MSSALKSHDVNSSLFHNLTAWFSKSVASNRKGLWIKYGGKEDDVTNAQFIFSEDINSKDTLSLFDSEDYLIGCLTVFNAQFIDACMKQQSAHKIPVSKYLMMPPGQPTEFSYFTEKVSKNTSVADAELTRKKAKMSAKDISPTSNQYKTSQERKPAPTTKLTDKWSGIPHVCDLPSVTGPLSDFIPGRNGCTVQRKV